MTEDEEVEQTLRELAEVMRPVLLDGLRKRKTGQVWKRDPTHEDAMHRHLHRYDRGELVDPHSKAHPLAHVMVRSGMIAWQDTHEV